MTRKYAGSLSFDVAGTEEQKDPSWLAHNSYKAWKDVAIRIVSHLSFVGSPSVTHTPVTSSLFCCSYRKQSLSQAVPPLSQHSAYSPTIPAGHSLQFTAAVPRVIPNIKTKVSTFSNCIETEIAGDVLGFCGCCHKTFVLTSSKTEEVCAEHHTMGQDSNKIRLITEQWKFL